MKFLHLFWQKITNTDALKAASGDHELLFFEFIYRVIYLCGLSTSDSSIYYFLYSTTIKIFLALLVCSELWNFFSITWTMETITDGINVLMIQFGAVSKYVVMVRHKDVFKSIASSMVSENFDLSTKNRKKIFETWRKKNKAILNLLLRLGTVTLTVWHVYPLLDDLDYNLLVPMRLPFNYKTPILYSITYASTVIVFSYMSYFVMFSDLIMQVHLMHLLCQIDVLKDGFRNIIHDCNVDFIDINNNLLHLNKDFTQAYKRRLGKLVNQHIFILNNTIKLRDLMSTPMLIHLTMSTTLICSIGFQITTSVDVNVTKGLMSLFYLGYNMLVLYIICRWCEEVKIQSENVGEAVYCSGWENGLVMIPGVRSSILLILARSNNPTALSAGGMYELSLQSYANMVKTSYSALTVLLRFR